MLNFNIAQSLLDIHQQGDDGSDAVFSSLHNKQPMSNISRDVVLSIRRARISSRNCRSYSRWVREIRLIIYHEPYPTSPNGKALDQWMASCRAQEIKLWLASPIRGAASLDCGAHQRLARAVPSVAGSS
jgi:hypothetical protein